jgi:acyl dehydratase
MTHSSSGQESEKPELLYDDLQPGRTFEPMSFPITPELVAAYRRAVADDFDSVTESLDGARSIAPAGLWGIWGRQAYLQHHRMPGGGILAGQDMEYHSPAYIGDVLTVQARVAERYERKERPYATIESTAHNEAGELCGVVRVTAIWPK